MTLSTTTQIWPVCRVGSYDGDVLDPDYVLDVESEQEYFDNEAEEEDRGKRIVSWEFDNERWDEAVIKAAQDAFDRNKPLEKYGVKRVKVVRYWHPREYNFVTDCLYVDAELDDGLSVEDFVGNAIAELRKPEHRDRICRYIKENWVSRDGFVSFMPVRSYDDLFVVAASFCSPDGEEVDFERFIGSILCLLSLVEGELEDHEFEESDLGHGPITEDIIEYLRQNHTVGEFYLIYKPEEILRRYGVNEPDWDDETAMLEDACSKYKACFDKDSEQYKKCDEFLKESRIRIENLRAEFLDTLDNSVDAYKDEKTGEYDYSKAVLKPSWLENVNDKAKEINDEFVNGLRIEENKKRQSW